MSFKISISNFEKSKCIQRQLDNRIFKRLEMLETEFCLQMRSLFPQTPFASMEFITKRTLLIIIMRNSCELGLEISSAVNTASD